MRVNEKQMQIALAQFIRAKYPGVLFHSDYGSGSYLMPRQATIQRLQNGGLRGYPDLFIAEPRKNYHGMFIELKKEGTRLKKKNGDWVSPHLAEQAEMLGKLSERGYCCQFAIGLDEAMEAVQNYLDGKNSNSA